MAKHPLDIFADNLKSSQESYFSELPISSDFLELDLKGNPKTGSQIKNWISAGVIKMKKEMENWDRPKLFIPALSEEPEIKQFDKLLSAEANPQTLPDLGYFELFKSSKLTDFITGSCLQQYGLIISKKAKEIFEQFNLGQAKFYPLTLEHKGNFYGEYFLLKTLSSGVEFIDFEKSTFYHQRGLLEFETRRDIAINSFQDVINHRQKFSVNDADLYIKKIVLADSFPNFDYFTFYRYGVHKRFVSPKLATALKQTTGHEIKQTNRIFR